MSAARMARPAAILLALALAGPVVAADPITWSTVDGGGIVHATGGAFRLSGTVGQPDAAAMTGAAYVLRGGFWGAGPAGTVDVAPAAGVASVLRFRSPVPNPARSDVRLSFDLPAPAEARLRVFDLGGRAVRTIAFGRLGAGPHERTWRAVDESGRALPSGLYFLRLEAGASAIAKRVMILH